MTYHNNDIKTRRNTGIFIDQAGIIVEKRDMMDTVAMMVYAYRSVDFIQKKDG
jgi:hypothetical protein